MPARPLYLKLQFSVCNKLKSQNMEFPTDFFLFLTDEITCTIMHRGVRWGKSKGQYFIGLFYVASLWLKSSHLPQSSKQTPYTRWELKFSTEIDFEWTHTIRKWHLPGRISSSEAMTGCSSSSLRRGFGVFKQPPWCNMLHTHIFDRFQLLQGAKPPHSCFCSPFSDVAFSKIYTQKKSINTTDDFSSGCFKWRPVILEEYVLFKLWMSDVKSKTFQLEVECFFFLSWPLIRSQPLSWVLFPYCCG